MSKWKRAVAALSLGLLLATPALADSAEEIMAIAKAQSAAENQNRAAVEAWTSIADDYTEFNPVMPTLVEGKAQAARFYEAGLDSGDQSLASEMLNPHVQFYGDTAILTYNYGGLTRSKDGKTTPNLAKSTRVYVKQKGKWMLVHANFAPVVVQQ